MAETSFLRAAVRPRMLGLLAVLAVAATGCALLGTWQLDRAEARGAIAQQQREQAVWTAEPVPLAELLAPQQTFPGEFVGRRAVTRGVFEGGSLLVAGRAHDGAVGYLVLAPLRLVDDDGGSPAPGAPVLAVVRGWVADPEAVPAAPPGPVEVTGYLQAGEGAGRGVAADGSPLPAGQTDAISMAQLVNAWGGPIYTGYLVQSEPAPQPGLTALNPPALPGAGLAWRNIMYAVQWWLFGGFALAIWARAVRDEARGVRRGSAPALPESVGEPTEAPTR